MESSAVFTLRLLQRLAEGCTLQELLEEAAKLGLWDVSVCDAAYNLLASSHPPRNDNVFVLQQSDRRIMRPEIVADMQQKGISRRLAKTSRPFWFYNEQLGQWELFCAVLSSGQVLGYLFHRPEKPPTEDEVICWIALSQGVAVTMQRSGSIEPDAGRKMQETILLQLALGQLTDSSIVQARLEQSGWKALVNYRLGCLFTEEVSLFSVLRPEQLSVQLRNVLPGCICCCYRDCVIILGSGSLEEQSSIRLRHWLKYHHFHIAVSAAYLQLIDTPVAYTQAQELMCAERVMDIQDSLPEIVFYEDHLPLCAYLSTYKKEELLRHIHPHIRFFQQYDREHQTQYIQTLMVYFSCGRNMTRTSNALFIHKTTLFYRFERMEKLVGPFLQQPKRLFLYEYSLHLLHEITPCPGV